MKKIQCLNSHRGSYIGHKFVKINVWTINEPQTGPTLRAAQRCVCDITRKPILFLFINRGEKKNFQWIVTENIIGISYISEKQV